MTLPDMVIWIATAVLLLAVALVGALAAAEGPRRREDGLDAILRAACRRKGDCP